jgi:hypothetical protein
MAQANYKQCVTAMRDRKNFRGNTLWGEWQGGAYRVYSYRTLMLETDSQGTPVFFNDSRYSVTTSKHQNYIRQAFFFEVTPV